MDLKEEWAFVVCCAIASVGFVISRQTLTKRMIWKNELEVRRLAGDAVAGSPRPKDPAQKGHFWERDGF